MVCFTRSKYGRSGGIWGMFPVVLVERLLLGRTAVLGPRDVPSTSVQYSWSAECSQDGVVRTPLPWQHGSQFRRFYRF